MKRHRAELVVASLVLFASAVGPSSATADPEIRCMGVGQLTFGDDGFAVCVQAGTASHLGNYSSYAEIVFRSGDDGALDGVGVVAFVAADGDRLVGVTTWHIKADGATEVAVRWRDAVTFANGTTVVSTGRFAESRPPGANTECTTDIFGNVTCKAPRRRGIVE